MFTPLLTYIDMGYVVVILIFIFGIIGIIKSIVEKRFGVNFVFSILSVVLGGVMLAFPKTMIYSLKIMLIVTAFWIIMMGIVTIFNSVLVTKAGGSGLWVLQLIFGILGILVGFYSLFNPMLLAITEGILIGIYFIEAGFTMIFSSALVKKQQ